MMHSRLEANTMRAYPQDRAADAVASLENRARYLAQSQATLTGRPAELPERAQVRLFVYANGED